MPFSSKETKLTLRTMPVPSMALPPVSTVSTSEVCGRTAPGCRMSVGEMGCDLKRMRLSAPGMMAEMNMHDHLSSTVMRTLRKPTGGT